MHCNWCRADYNALEWLLSERPPHTAIAVYAALIELSGNEPQRPIRWGRLSEHTHPPYGYVRQELKAGFRWLLDHKYLRFYGDETGCRIFGLLEFGRTFRFVPMSRRRPENRHHAAVLAEALGACRECRAIDGELLVHHMNGDPTDNRRDNLWVCCGRCHASYHPRQKD
jgi:hypothetical protein